MFMGDRVCRVNSQLDTGTIVAYEFASDDAYELFPNLVVQWDGVLELTETVTEHEIKYIGR